MRDKRDCNRVPEPKLWVDFQSISLRDFVILINASAEKY